MHSDREDERGGEDTGAGDESGEESAEPGLHNQLSGHEAPRLNEPVFRDDLVAYDFGAGYRGEAVESVPMPEQEPVYRAEPTEAGVWVEVEPDPPELEPDWPELVPSPPDSDDEDEDAVGGD